ncbi:PAS domain S-box protein [Longimicrobium sp.]|uniref:PAS domain S-box protein n=1 Tax=Longimicrobium sp. TaxID=2029185 RepID=UPI002C3BE5B3|nr:PAS domain S-box protein [Longimicrobium sp.]HSU14161.1 PAS domain S-box protein [Longimicrobium sp.]
MAAPVPDRPSSPFDPGAAGARERPARVRYGAALAGTAVALAVSLSLRQFIAPNVFIFFFAAVILTAWFGGRGPALLVTVLALPLVNWFFLDAPFAWSTAPVTLLRLALFASLAVLIGTMRESLDAARRRAVEAARESGEHALRLEEQAVELESQAAELEAQTEEAQVLAEELAEANRRLEESAARSLAEAQALAHVGSWEWEVERDHVWWSDEMYRVYGFRPGEVRVTLGTFLERVHPGDRGRVRAAVERSVETGEPFELDHRIVLSDGEARMLHARGRAETDGRGRVVRMAGTGQDVTGARQAEETARRLAAEQAARAEAEAGRWRLEAILEGIGEAFLAVDAEWRCTWANRRAEEMMRTPRAAFLGRVVNEAFPEIEQSPSWEVLHRVARERRPEHLEFHSRALGGWFSLHVAPWDGGISMFFEDVTGQRQAQEERARLAAIVESSEDAIFSKSLDGTVLTWNRGAERLYGYTAGEMVGRSVALLAPPDRPDEIPDILRWIAAGERLPSFETVRVRRDGTPIDVLLAISPLHDAAGRVTGASTIARDVTERKRTEAALRAGEARYRRLIETAEEGIWLLDAEGRTTYVNERMTALLGRPAAEIAGRPLTAFVHPDARAEVAAHLARRMDGARERHDVRLVRADGSDLWALVSLSTVSGGQAEEAGTLAMVTDVTDRRRAEESMRFLAEASRVLAQSLDYPTVLASLSRLVVPRLADWCAVVLAGDGGPQAEVAHADPARAPRVRELLAVRAAAGGETTIGGAVRSGRSVLVEDHAAEVLRGQVAHPRYDELLAELAPVSLVIVPLVLDGAARGAIVLASADAARRYGPADRALAEELARRAATALENARLHQAEHEARRQAERAAGQIARLQAVTAGLATARTMEEVAQAALGESMRALGAAAGWISQLKPASDRVELVWATGHAADVMDEFRSVPLDLNIPLADAVRTGEILCLESREALERLYPGIPDRGQRSRYGAWAVVPMWVEGRAVGGLVLNFAEARAFDGETRDYLLAVARQGALALERARLYEAERTARAEAEAANRAKFEFLTTMSHELRTPLNAIAGYVDLLELEIRGPLTEAQHADLQRIRRSQTHLLGLINDVLNFARIETGHVHFDVRDVAVGELLEGVEELIAPQVRARGQSYEYRRCDAAVEVRADAEKLRQIVLNLLSNAVKFTPEGGCITLSGEADGDAVRVRVADTGIGIPADKLGTIFEPFVQVNAGYTRTSEGTGLGLSISRDLARAMGGELDAESREGEGSVFTLILPRAPSSPTTASEGQAEAAETRSASGS